MSLAKPLSMDDFANLSKKEIKKLLDLLESKQNLPFLTEVDRLRFSSYSIILMAQWGYFLVFVRWDFILGV